MRRHADRPHARPAAAVRNAKGLVQINVAHIRAQFARLRDADHGVEVCAVQIHLAASGVHHLANLADAFLKHAVRGGVSDHHCRQITRVFTRLGAEVFEVDVAFLTAFHRHNLHAGQHRTGRIRPVRAGGNQANVPVRLIAAGMEAPDGQQPGIFALRACIRLERHRGKAGDFRQPRFQLGKHFAVTGCLPGRHKRM